MKRHDRSRLFYADQEVLELLADEPELLAVVDAVAQTGHGAANPAHPVRFRRVALAAAIGVAAVATLLVIPWRGGGLGIVERAAAAISKGAVVHMRFAQPTRDDVTVDLSTGQEHPGRVEIETWYDETSSQLRTRTMRNGVAIADVVRRVEPGGTVAGSDPALTLFASRYRQALEVGRARVIREGVAPRLQVAVSPSSRQIVTLDAENYEPVAFTSGTGDEAVRWSVTAIDSRQRARGDFVAGGVAGAQGGSVSSARRIDVAALARGGGLWLGQTFRGLVLERIFADTLTWSAAGGARTVGSGDRLIYRSRDGEVLQVQLAARPEPAYGYVEGRFTLSFNPIPDEGSVSLSRGDGATALWIAQLRQDRRFVTIRAKSKVTALAAARMLRPIRR